MISLFYQAWEKYRFTIAYERGERDRFSHHLLDLIGLGTPGCRSASPVPDDSLLFYSGLFALHARSAVALRQILTDYFDVPVEVEQFVGAWYPLSGRISAGLTTRLFPNSWGSGRLLAMRFGIRGAGVRVRLGPLDLTAVLGFSAGRIGVLRRCARLRKFFQWRRDRF